jgi:hypothetical protein
MKHLQMMPGRRRAAATLLTEFASTDTLSSLGCLDTSWTALSRDDEQCLVGQARDGSSSAIEELVSRYEHKLFRLARNIMLNHQDAEEVVQNAFVSAFRKPDSFRGLSRFSTWLVRIGDE